MKIEIDLNNILGDEYGTETLQESVRRQVVESLAETMKKGILKKIDEETSRIMNEQLQEVLKAHMPDLVNDVMNAEYTPISRYGEKSGPTTFRAELIKSVVGNMKYEPKNYSSEENAFTRGVKGVIEEHIKAFKTEFANKVDVDFKRDALAYAVKTLSDRLGLPK